MNHQTSHEQDTARFKGTSLRTRVMSAVMSGAVSLGVMACVVGGMAEQSGGQSLGEFVASHGGQNQATRVAVAPVASKAL